MKKKDKVEVGTAKKEGDRLVASAGWGIKKKGEEHVQV
jgi:hypothetical protein